MFSIRVFVGANKEKIVKYKYLHCQPTAALPNVDLARHCVSHFDDTEYLFDNKLYIFQRCLWKSRPDTIYVLGPPQQLAAAKFATFVEFPSYTTMRLQCDLSKGNSTAQIISKQSEALPRKFCQNVKGRKRTGERVQRRAALPRIWKSSFRITSSAPLVPGRSGRIWQECNISKCFRGKMHFLHLARPR